MEKEKMKRHTEWRKKNQSNKWDVNIVANRVRVRKKTYILLYKICVALTGRYYNNNNHRKNGDSPKTAKSTMQMVMNCWKKKTFKGRFWTNKKRIEFLIIRHFIPYYFIDFNSFFCLIEPAVESNRVFFSHFLNHRFI